MYNYKQESYMYLYSFPSTKLNPVQINTAEACSGNSLEAGDIVIINVNIEHCKVTFYIVPFGERLQYLLE